MLRRTSDAVLIAERRTERGTSYGYFHLFHLEDRVRVLWEAFDETGVHLFFLLEGSTLPAQLLAFVDPIDGAGDNDGDIEEIQSAEFSTSAAAARLAEARAVTTVLVLARESDVDPTAFTLFSTPDGVVLMETDGQEDTAVQRVGKLSRDSVHALVEELVAATGPDAAQ